MAGAQQLWSTTPNNNQTADPAVNQREGMAPSQVNDAARQIMAKLKAYMLDTSGALVTGGTGSAYTLTTNEGITSLTDGLTLGFRVHTANTGAATLAVDGLTAKPLHKATQADLAANDLVGATVYRATYRASADDWLLHEVPARLAALQAAANLSDIANAVTARTNLGVGAGDSPQFAGVNIGHATDTTITRTGAGDIAVEGNAVYRAGGTDVPVADGGTGASAAADARTNLGLPYASQANVEAAAAGVVVTPAVQHFHPGHPKAGGNFDGSGAPAFRAGDYGMGAITDNGIGTYTLALDTAFADTNYWATVFARDDDDGASQAAVASSGVSGTKTASSFQVMVEDLAASRIDSSEVGITFWGDYA